MIKCLPESRLDYYTTYFRECQGVFKSFFKFFQKIFTAQKEAHITKIRSALAYINIMVENIARVLGASVEQINIKATTEEGMGFTGRMEGVCAYATCLLTL